LEEGTYAVPLGESAGERRREITAQELGALLSGIDLKQATRRRRYRGPHELGVSTHFSLVSD
jgi:hypothetical protein